MKTIVLHAADVKKVLPKVAGSPFAWLYLGQDMAQAQRISRVLGQENRYPLSDRLQQTALKEKQPFLDFIAELGLHQKNKLLWWASNIAYKSPLADDLFLLWCYAAVFEQACLDETDRALIVLVQDPWLYRYLWQRHGVDFSFPNRNSTLPEALSCIRSGIMSRGYFVLKAGYQARTARRIDRSRKATVSRGNGGEVYLCSWIEERSFKKDGEFEDAYLGRLRDILKKSGKSVTYIALPFLSRHLMKKCLDYSSVKFTFLDRYIGLRAILRSLFSFFRISLPQNGDSRFLSLRVLLQREMFHELPGFSANMLYYHAFRAWLKEMQGKEVTVIYPFENQVWDKMLCVAARESEKAVRLIAYQHSMVPLLLLNYFPGAGESRFMPLPDCIVTDGEYTLNLLKNAGYGETKLVNGGALRYEHLYEGEKAIIRKDVASKSVLVALPGLRSVTEELLIALFDAFGDSPENGLRFMVKFHPDLPPERLGLRLPPWPAHFLKVEKPIPEMLKEAGVVIYSSSTSGLEALAAGVPVIRYCSEHTLDLDPSGRPEEVGIESCSYDNIKEVVLSAFRRRDSLNRESGTSSLHRFLSPVDERVWEQVLKPGMER